MKKKKPAQFHRRNKHTERVEDLGTDGGGFSDRGSIDQCIRDHRSVLIFPLCVLLLLLPPLLVRPRREDDRGAVAPPPPQEPRVRCAEDGPAGMAATADTKARSPRGCHYLERRFHLSEKPRQVMNVEFARFRGLPESTGAAVCLSIPPLGAPRVCWFPEAQC